MRDTTYQYGRCLAAAFIVKITPPENIYHRMWGAALHDQAEGVHQQLECNVLWLRAVDGSAELLLLSVDHCLFWKDVNEAFKQTVSDACGVPLDNIVVYFTHTHGAGLMDPGRSELPGGDLIAPYLAELGQKVAKTCEELSDQLEQVWLTAGMGNCGLATNRDYYDVERQGFVCGFNPLQSTDQTLLTIKVARENGELLSVISNYACHPTTLAWDNKLVSPDYVGAMRKTMRHALGRIPIVFVQGASGDVGPREGYVGDVKVAERNGRQLGLANLEVLAGMPEIPSRYSYDGAVVSGATIGVWSYKPFSESELEDLSSFTSWSREVLLNYREDLGTAASVSQKIDELEAVQGSADARAWTEVQQRDHRALLEREHRKLTRISKLESIESFTYTIRSWSVGEIVLLGLNGELYNCYQTRVREAVGDRAVVVGTLADGSDCWYLLDQASYGKGLYQEEASVIKQGGLEMLIEATIKVLNLA
ncbi:MAG: hypothetical protein CMJ76_14655 [Planctomycetaceae bacterium]|nr:hypothetical protein [Planctomycetaceae bacterium]